jgi:hypothetical protein
MTTKMLVCVSAGIEVTAGVAFIAVPNLVATMLLGVSLSDSGIAFTRLAGAGLLSLGLACWPGGDAAAQPAIRALFTYNLLVAIYFGYLRVGGGFVSYLLWPACVGHAGLALLLARPAYDVHSDRP